MSDMRKSRDPDQRMGAFKRHDQVPHEYRLEHYQTHYTGRNIWAEFVKSRPGDFESKHHRRTYGKAGRSWKALMTDRGRHHALAVPEDIYVWCDRLATDRTVGTVYSEYFLRVEQFYTWLQFQTVFPHVHHPVLMAASEYELVSWIWEQKFATSAGKDEHE